MPQKSYVLRQIASTKHMRLDLDHFDSSGRKRSRYICGTVHRSQVLTKDPYLRQPDWDPNNMIFVRRVT